MRRQTIRKRFYRELLLFGLLMVLGGGYGLITVYLWGLEDTTQLSYMDLADSVEKGMISDEELANHWPDSFSRVWRGVDNVPANVLDIFPARFHRAGELLVQYEYTGQAMTGEPSYGFTFNFFSGPPDRVHFFLQYPSASTRDIYVYHVLAASLSAQIRQKVVFLIVSINAVVVLLVVLLLARRLSGAVLKPVSDLAAMAAAVDEQQSVRDFPVAQQPNEIGDVARTLQQSMQRLHDYHERESQFLRQASHELRTPIAVISSSLDVLNQRRASGNTDINRPIADIKRSAGAMRDIVEALLWLARSETESPGKSATIPAQQIVSLLEDHRYLLANKPVTVTSQDAEEAVIDIEQPYFRIVLSNLIRNAFEHTEEGSIEIACTRRKFVIKNPLQNAGSRDEKGQLSAGFGIGMTVIEAISEKLGWTLSVSAQCGDIIIELDFQSALTVDGKAF